MNDAKQKENGNQRLAEKYKLGYRLGKNAMIKLFKNLKITSLNKGDKYLSIKLRREKSNKWLLRY